LQWGPARRPGRTPLAPMHSPPASWSRNFERLTKNEAGDVVRTATISTLPVGVKQPRAAPAISEPQGRSKANASRRLTPRAPEPEADTNDRVPRAPPTGVVSTRRDRRSSP